MFGVVDKQAVGLSLLLVTILVTSGVYYPSLLISIHGPVSYVFFALVIFFLFASSYNSLRGSWLWCVLFGSMTLFWGLHNIIGPRTVFITGYGFASIGILSVVVGVYARIAPPAWPNLSLRPSDNSG